MKVIIAMMMEAGETPETLVNQTTRRYNPTDRHLELVRTRLWKQLCIWVDGLSVVKMRIFIFWVVKPHGLVGRNQSSSSSLNVVAVFFSETFVPTFNVQTALQPRRPTSAVVHRRKNEFQKWLVNIKTPGPGNAAWKRKVKWRSDRYNCFYSCLPILDSLLFRD